MGAAAGFGRRLIVFGLVVSLTGVPLTFGQTARSESGYLTGRIFVADGVTPRAGVVVKAANLSTSQVFTSTQTDGSGRYSLTDLPSGQYQIAVETGEGLYVNQDQVPVLQGRKTLFSLALSPSTAQENPPQENPPSQEPPQAQPPAQNPPPENPKPEEKKKEKGKKEKSPSEQGTEQKKGGGFWRSGWGVAIGLGGGAIILGLLADSIAGKSEEVPPPPSQSTP